MGWVGISFGSWIVWGYVRRRIAEARKGREAINIKKYIQK